MRLDNATPAQLVRALTNDNLFWRLTAQRLIVERKPTSVWLELIGLADNQSVDSLGLNVGALHALWTMHGLGLTGVALTAARRALYHPAASVRRAALQMLPRDEQLVNTIFAAGILPDRTSPWPVEYTVPTAVLEDADAHVRLEALLALSEMPGSPRIAASVTDVIMSPENARDAWIPDAIAMVGARQGPEFLTALVKRRMPATDSLAMAGIRRSVQKVARYHAATANADVVVNLIAAVPEGPAVAVALLNGIAQGWPEERLPQLSAEQRSTLQAAARGASAELAETFGRVAARWQLPDVFRAP